MDKITYRKDLNLLDRVNDKALKSNPKGTFIIIVAIIIVFIILVSIFVPKMIVSSKNDELKGLQNQLTANKIYEEEYDSLVQSISLEREKLADLKVLQNGGLTRVLELLETLVPASGIRIEQMSIDSDTSITITGTANDEKTIADFLVSLNDCENITAISVSGAESVIDSSVEAQTFTVWLTYSFAE